MSGEQEACRADSPIVLSQPDKKDEGGKEGTNCIQTHAKDASLPKPVPAVGNPNYGGGCVSWQNLKRQPSLKGLFTIFFLSFKSHILDSNGVWYS